MAPQLSVRHADDCDVTVRAGAVRWGARAGAPDVVRHDGRDRIVPVGDVQEVAAPARLRTLLGSCVAVTVWHPVARVGGMCHAVNARRGRGSLDVDRPSAWFAEEAVPRLLGWARRIDHRLTAWEVKVFGGGRQFSGTGRMDVPSANLAEVRAQLDRFGLEPAAWHVGGTGSRMVVLDVGSGGVWLSHRPRPDVDGRDLPLRVSRRRCPAHGPSAAQVLARLPAQ